MVSHIVSFLLSDKEIELLRQYAIRSAESSNAIAQRLLKSLLGMSAEPLKTANGMEERLPTALDAQIETIAVQAGNNCIREHLQEMATFLGEYSA